MGRQIRTQILELLPADWSFQGKRVLDFGCGSGRVLRHFSAEAEIAQFLGADIDEEAISWVSHHLSPRFEVFKSEPEPPLPLESESVDLVFAFSVFTHLTDNWAAWLLELRRILRPDGLLIATFLNSALGSLGGWTGDKSYGEWNEEQVGMNVLQDLDDWDLGGPLVVHSLWWIEEHWGRAFEILELQPVGFGADGVPGIGQGYALLRKKQGEPTVEGLERISPDDARELDALRCNIRQLRLEMRALSDAYESTHSWRLTAPLRAFAARLRAAKTTLNR